MKMRFKERLQKFLTEADMHGYAVGNYGRKEKDGSQTISYKKGAFQYNDNYFGGEPYGGRTVVLYKGKPLYIIVYYGAVIEGEKDVKGVYSFLQEALRRKTYNGNFSTRGPALFKSGSLRYINKWNGNIDGFSGREEIYRDDKKVYSAEYAGGFVDQRGE